MQNVTIVSTSDSEEAVTEALGLAKTEEVKETKAEAPNESDAEAKTDSEDSEADDSKEELDAKEKDEDKEQKPKKKGGFQKKIDKLTRERNLWRDQALAVSQAGKEAPKETVEKKADTSLQGKPSADQFETHAEFVEALADWKLEERLAKDKQQQKALELKSQEQKAIETHQARVKEFAKGHQDFSDVIAEVDDVPMSLAVQHAILKSENGPELMYELAKDRELYEKISGLDYTQATFELGKFQAKLEMKASESDEKPKLTKTKAPPPLSAIGSKSASVQKDPDKMDFQEFKKWREETLRNR